MICDVLLSDAEFVLTAHPRAVVHTARELRHQVIVALV